MKCFRVLTCLIVAGAIQGCSTAGSPRADVTDAGARATSATSSVEEIYVLRSLREERSAPDAFCDAAKIGFTAKVQDKYSFRAVATRPSDGRIVDAKSHEAGTILTCFDGAPGVADANFYAEGTIAGVQATGKGKCTAIAPNLPEAGITSVRCFLVLSNLPAPYVSGVLTTNTVASRKPLGDESDPPGYVQPSIATIRLWRNR